MYEQQVVDKLHKQFALIVHFAQWSAAAVAVKASYSMQCAAVRMTCCSQRTYSLECCVLVGMLHAAGMYLQVEKVKKAVETAKSMRSDLFLEGQCCCIGCKCCAFCTCRIPNYPS